VPAAADAADQPAVLHLDGLRLDDGIALERPEDDASIGALDLDEVPRGGALRRYVVMP
jgi:hypothetical protein